MSPRLPLLFQSAGVENRESELDAATWARVFREAAALGVLQVHLSGGEPASRRDLVEIVAAAREAGLYTNLITSGHRIDAARLQRLKEVASITSSSRCRTWTPRTADRIAGYRGAHTRKLAFARTMSSSELALTINVVMHRANIER